MTRFFTTFCLIFSICLPALAQVQLDLSDVNAAIETQRQVTQAQRTMIITDNLQLTSAESEEFWPLYREYRADVAKLDDRFIALIRRYAEKYESLDDKEAMALLKESFDIEANRTKLAKRFSTKFDKIMAGAKVVRFMQIESRLDAIMDLKVKNSIPLAN